MGRDTSKLDLARGQCHHHEYVIRHPTVPRRDLHREEVRGSQHLPGQREELRPAHAALAALRRRVSVLAAQDSAHRTLVDMMFQV